MGLRSGMNINIILVYFGFVNVVIILGNILFLKM